MTENEIAKAVVDACFQIHVRLGPGLLESVYCRVLEYELRKRGLCVRREVVIPFCYDGMQFDEGFRADLIVEEKVSGPVLTPFSVSGSRQGSWQECVRRAEAPG